jgi:STE24 endopeptidase
LTGWRRAAWISLAVLGIGTAATIAVTTPWHPLGRAVPHPVAPDPARDFTPAQIDRAESLSHALNGPSYGALAVGLVVAVALGFTPLGARLFQKLTARVPTWPLRVAVAGLALTVVSTLVTLPFAAWSHVVLRRYGLTVQGWPGWLSDQGIGFGVTAVATMAVLVLAFWLVRALPRGWFAPAAIAAFLLVVLVSYGYPLVYEPLYNNFTPMKPGALRTELLDLARRDGVPVRDVLVADASKRTTSVNAYVSGFGGTRRIVVYDTLLRTTPPAQIRLIVAHELGHAKRGDVLYGTLIGALGASTGVCLLYLVVTAPAVRRRAGVGDAPLADARGVALVIAAVTVGTLLSSPAQNLVSRQIEARADAHALNLTHDPATFAVMQRDLSVRNLSDPTPDPFDYVMYATHPTGPQRIAMARDWSRLHDRPEPPDLAR